MSTLNNPNEHDASFPAPLARSGMPDWYPEMPASVSDKVSTGRVRAVTAVNQELVATYWAIGREILGRQGQEGWGAKVIDRLSSDLRDKFPDARGLSPRTLKYMRSFAEAWPRGAIVQQPLAQLPWGHNVTLMEKPSELVDHVEKFLLELGQGLPSWANKSSSWWAKTKHNVATGPCNIEQGHAKSVSPRLTRWRR